MQVWVLTELSLILNFEIFFYSVLGIEFGYLHILGKILPLSQNPSAGVFCRQ